MEEMRRIAFEIVQRACLFGSLTIFCVMVGMSFEPRLAFQAGGTLTTFMALILDLQSARSAHQRLPPDRDCGSISRRISARRQSMRNGRAHGYARNLFYLRTVDCGDRDRHVGSGTPFRVGGSLIVRWTGPFEGLC